MAPAPQATRNAAPPKRIIKKIQLDFNKLKEAGLDRQLAEVLRKQKLEAMATRPLDLGVEAVPLWTFKHRRHSSSNLSSRHLIWWAQPKCNSRRERV